MRTIEKLSHFRCSRCGGWFSIGDAPLRRKRWFCPWCGFAETHENAKKDSADFSEKQNSNSSDSCH